MYLILQLLDWSAQETDNEHSPLRSFLIAVLTKLNHSSDIFNEIVLYHKFLSCCQEVLEIGVNNL